MRWLELKIPPPAVALVFGVLMWLASKLTASLQVPFGIHVAIAVPIGCVSLVFGFAGMRSFVRAKTTMNPTKPSTTSS